MFAEAYLEPCQKSMTKKSKKSKVTTTDIRYFVGSNFSRSLVYDKQFSS